MACAGIGVASAGGDNTTAALGLKSASHNQSSEQAGFGVFDSNADEGTLLGKTNRRDISQGIEAITVKEEAERRAAEEAARIAEEKRLAEEAARQAELNALHEEANARAMALGLQPVNWNVDRDTFINEWGTRIDAYLAGSPLSGYGRTFAEASWNYGVDPRWSPAISNTESTKGANCFRAYNAWGWMSTSGWSSWETAIDGHVKGLANGYGGSISLWAAQKYCPPTYNSWYQNTLSQMYLI